LRFEPQVVADVAERFRFHRFDEDFAASAPRIETLKTDAAITKKRMPITAHRLNKLRSAGRQRAFPARIT
jgi:hypothetical protein